MVLFDSLKVALNLHLVTKFYRWRINLPNDMSLLSGNYLGCILGLIEAQKNQVKDL